MKARLTSAAVGLTILAIVLTLFDTIVLNIVISLIIACCIYELLEATGQLNRPVIVTAMLFGAVIPFFNTSLMSRIFPLICLIFAVVLLLFTLRYHGRIKVDIIGFSFFFALAIAFSITCAVYVRDNYGKATGFYAVLMALGGAWLNDTGAYFTGMLIGRRKLAPVISPKKTVEGFIGGVIVSLLSQLLLSFAFERICALYSVTVDINYLIVLVTAPLVALASVLGDLAASAIKRQFGIKDFGNIMPGHGGVLDRFDSVLLSIPVVYNILLYLPVINIK